MEQEMKERIAFCLYSTWDAIADDMFHNDMGEHDPSMVIPKAEVVEVACDRAYDGFVPNDDDAHTEWRKLKHDDPIRKEIIDLAFTYETYGY